MKLGKLFKAVVDTASIPLSVVADVATLGGITTGNGSYTKNKVEKIADELDEVLEESKEEMR